MGEPGEAVHADVRQVARLGGTFDLVVCNPPYVEPGRGRPSKVAATARMGALADFIVAARALLAARGRACFVYPASELLALGQGLRDAGLEPKRLRLVHASADQPARVVLVEALPAKRGGLVVLPPLVERDAGGPSAELVRLLRRSDEVRGGAVGVAR